MKTFILCGGFGTRLDYEGKLKAKPMVKIGNKPILMHIVDIYRKYGKSNFVVLAGYKQEVICEYFQNNYKKQGHVFWIYHNLLFLNPLNLHFLLTKQPKL